MVRNGHHASWFVDDDQMLVESEDFLWVEIGLCLGLGGAHAQFDAVALSDGPVAFGDAGAVEEHLPGVDPGTGFYPRQVEVMFDGLVEPGFVQFGRDEAIRSFVLVVIRCFDAPFLGDEQTLVERPLHLFLSERVSNKSEYVSFSSRGACRKAGSFGRKPFRAASFLAFGCVAAEGQGPTGIDASPAPCQNSKMPAATPIRTYWTLSEALPPRQLEKIGFLWQETLPNPISLGKLPG